MWVNNEFKKNTYVISIAYDDFSTIEVEKKMNRKGIIEYELSLHIEGVQDFIASFYRLEDVSSVLSKLKSLIEELDNEIDYLDDNEIDAYIDRIEDALNNE